MMPARKPDDVRRVPRIRGEGRRASRVLNGDVFAMGGRTIGAGLIAAATSRLDLRRWVAGLAIIFSSDLRIRIRATGLTTYPDVSVVCGKAELDAEDPHAIVNPRVLVEVLSDSTEAYDRGEKAAHYRHLPSLSEYVLVSQHRPRIEVYRKNDAGRWELYEHEAGSRVELAIGGVRVRGRRRVSRSPRGGCGRRGVSTLTSCAARQIRLRCRPCPRAARSCSPSPSPPARPRPRLRSRPPRLGALRPRSRLRPPPRPASSPTTSLPPPPPPALAPRRSPRLSPPRRHPGRSRPRHPHRPPPLRSAPHHHRRRQDHLDRPRLGFGPRQPPPARHRDHRPLPLHPPARPDRRPTRTSPARPSTSASAPSP